ncbi:MAG: (4Fe-4S)-binding protein [Flavobacteriales bacterium]
MHCAECAKGLGEVFKPRQKPWIQMGTVSSEDIKTQVEKCPSGAISLKD